MPLGNGEGCGLGLSGYKYESPEREGVAYSDGVWQVGVWRDQRQCGGLETDREKCFNIVALRILLAGSAVDRDRTH